jgi:DNA-binding IclR family transcriptional regulator
MQKLPPPVKPPYTIGSVDRALRLLHMLRDHGEVRLRTAAAELGVAESTVHRLMAMLVFHGFAMQLESKAYVPGYGLGAAPAPMTWAKALRDTSVPVLEDLAARTGETVNLSVRVGTRIRFLWSCEGSRPLRIVSRAGVVIPAATSAGGRVLLADMPDEAVLRLYSGPGAASRGDELSKRNLQRLLVELRRVRVQGYARANQETELGVTAVAVPIRDEEGAAIASLAIAAPSVRDADLQSPDSLRQLDMARARIEERSRGHLT